MFLCLSSNNSHSFLLSSDLVHAKDRNGKYINKYVPYWESLENLREIDLSIEVLVRTN